MAVKSTHTSPRSYAGAHTFPVYRLAAVIAALLSYLTTLWAVEWVWPEGGTLARVGVAFVLEVLLTALKLALFSGGGHDGIGWIGFGFDAVLNAGGALPRASAVVLFPPIAAVLGALGLLQPATTIMATVNEQPLSYGGFLVAILGGIILSVAPHYLWTRGGNHARDHD